MTNKDSNWKIAWLITTPILVFFIFHEINRPPTIQEKFILESKEISSSEIVSFLDSTETKLISSLENDWGEIENLEGISETWLNHYVLNAIGNNELVKSRLLPFSF